MVNNTLYLTGLRGWSAFGVFLIHSGGGGLRDLGVVANKLVDFGKYGVISFFVLSALTLSMSISREQNFSYPHYLTRRFARIIPMYFISIIVFWYLGGQDYYKNLFGIKTHDILDLALHLSFMNLWVVKYQNSILGVEWTVPIEMWMYLIIPYIYFCIIKANTYLKFLILFLAILVSISNGLWHTDYLTKSWAVDSYFYCFIAGTIVCCYQGNSFISNNMSDKLVVLSLLLILVLCLLGAGVYSQQCLTILMMLLLIGLSRAVYTQKLFENKLMVFIGNISFPFYLLHFPILNFFSKMTLNAFQIFAFGLFATISISYVCHILIEKPVLKLSGRLHPYDR